MLLTVDSSVFVSVLRTDEAGSAICRTLIAAISNGKHRCIIPLTVPIEVAAAIARRTDDAEGAAQAYLSLRRAFRIECIPVNGQISDCAAEIAEERRLRGMDAIVAACAKIAGATLVTLDEEMIERLTGVIDVKRPSDIS